MSLDDKTCSKCGSPMKPGYPLEQMGDTGGFINCTRWIDGVPTNKRGWLGESTWTRLSQYVSFWVSHAQVADLSNSTSRPKPMFVFTLRRSENSKNRSGDARTCDLLPGEPFVQSNRRHAMRELNALEPTVVGPHPRLVRSPGEAHSAQGAERPRIFRQQSLANEAVL